MMLHLCDDKPLNITVDGISKTITQLNIIISPTKKTVEDIYLYIPKQKHTKTQIIYNLLKTIRLNFINTDLVNN